MSPLYTCGMNDIWALSLDREDPSFREWKELKPHTGSCENGGGRVAPSATGALLAALLASVIGTAVSSSYGVLGNA